MMTEQKNSILSDHYKLVLKRFLWVYTKVVYIRSNPKSEVIQKRAPVYIYIVIGIIEKIFITIVCLSVRPRGHHYHNIKIPLLLTANQFESQTKYSSKPLWESQREDMNRWMHSGLVFETAYKFREYIHVWIKVHSWSIICKRRSP